MTKRNLQLGEELRAKQPFGSNSQGLDRLLTIDQLVKLGGPCRAKLYDEIKLGRLRAIKFGRSTRIIESDWIAYLKSAPTL
jgi:hypothetical protein